MTREQEELLKRVDRKLSLLLQEMKKDPPPKWVDAFTISRMTGWTNQQMRKARVKKLITYRISKSGIRNIYEYDLNSIHERFFKH